jgi:hypothetical protein
MSPTETRPEKPQPTQLLGRLAMAVTTSLVQIAMGTLLGYWVDTWLGWMFFTPLGVCLGMALATRTLLKFMKQITPKISAPDSMVSGAMESGDNQEFED